VRTIEARRRVDRPREELWNELADLRSHWDLAGRWVEPLELRDNGGTVRVRGPFGLHRTIHTRLTELRAPECVVGEASSGSTLAAIRWDLEAGSAGTDVSLRADVVRATWLDRALLAAGGAWWMRSRFDATLKRLG
jgi:hypothetical protein